MAKRQSEKITTELSHRNLCLKASKYLKNHGIQPFHRCNYVVCELERLGECPDAFGFGSCTTQLIEVKASRTDFLSDKNKFWRKFPEFGLGKYRSYLCPERVINESDLPENWGLLWVDLKGNIIKVKEAEPQKNNHEQELMLITSILRREGIKPQVFSYKQYAINKKKTNAELVQNSK